MSEIEAQALDTFRRLVAVVYREIGVLDSRNHGEIAQKRKRSSGFFATPQRKIFANDGYQRTKKSADLDATVRTLEEVTGLSLADIQRAFAEGKWAGPGGRPAFASPRWVRIAEVTISLRSALLANDTQQIAELLKEIQTLEHNTGRVVAKFPELGPA